MSLDTSMDLRQLKPVPVLRKTISILSKPGTWTQGSSAKNGIGRVVNPGDTTAVCWCLTGAVMKTCPEWSARRYVWRYLKEALTGNRLSGFMDGVSLVDWNDRPTRTQAEVLDLLDSALVLAAEAEKDVQ